MRQARQIIASLRETLSRRNPGVVGALVAFVIALLWVLLGFFRMLFVVAMTLGGYFVGTRWFSNREDVRALLDKLFPPGFFR